MVRDDLAGLPDGSTLRRLDSGLEIKRRKKHEAIDLSFLSRAALVEKTDERRGSKFLVDWTLQRIVDWTAQVVIEEGWSVAPGIKATTVRHFARPVGIARGDEVNSIKVISDGRYVHAYPVGEDR